MKQRWLGFLLGAALVVGNAGSGGWRVSKVSAAEQDLFTGEAAEPAQALSEFSAPSAEDFSALDQGQPDPTSLPADDSALFTGSTAADPLFSDTAAGEEDFDDTQAGEEADSLTGLTAAVSAGPLLQEIDASQTIHVASLADIDPDEVKTTCTVYSGANLEHQSYTVWSAPISSYLVPQADGSIMRVQSGALDGQLVMEYYDSGYNLTRTVTLDLELPLFGGFYAGDNAYYVVTGQNNEEEDEAKTVIRVTKYSADWAWLGSADLKGANTVHPFDAGSLRFDMAGKYLLIHTCHEMYQSEDGYNHQANVTLEVDTDSMTITDSYTDVMNSSYGYVSHSFNQFVKVDEGKLVTVDHGDAYPRSIVLIKYPDAVTGGRFSSFMGSWSSYCTTIDLLSFPGSTGANYTGASVGGFEYSSDSYLVAGSQDASFGDSSCRNVFVASVPKNATSSSAVTLRWFTDYAQTDESATTPHLVKLSSSRFALLWQSQGTVYVQLLDGAGAAVGSTVSFAGNLSDCVPVLMDGNLCWYTWKNETLAFYEVSASNPSDHHALVITNGHKFEMGEAHNGEVTATCRVCGYQETYAVPTEVGRLLWQASDSGSYTYYYGVDTEIHPSQGFNYWLSWNYTSSLSNRKSDLEVLFSEPDIMTVTNPDAPSLFETLTAQKPGIVTVTFQAKYNPEAHSEITFYINAILDKYVTLDQTQFIYNGKEHRPAVTVTFLGDTLVEGTDFEVFYENNVNVGTGTVRIVGIGNYAGEVTREISIAPKDLSEIQFAPIDDQIFQNNFLTPGLVLTDPDQPENALVAGRDFEAEYEENVHVGTGLVTVQGIGNYTGSLEGDFTILPRSIQLAAASPLPNQEYLASELTPDPEITDLGRNLEEDLDYILEYRDNIQAGWGTITVEGIGDYEDTLELVFYIEPRSISLAVAEEIAPLTYSGQAQEPLPVLTDLEQLLQKDVDYTLAYEENTNAEENASCLITGIGNYTGQTIQLFTILPLDVNELEVEDLPSFIYDQTAHTPLPVVQHEDILLQAGTDYAVSYEDNVHAGSALVLIKGLGNFGGEREESFEILPKSISLTSVGDIPSRTYDGTRYQPHPVITDQEVTLEEGRDYELSYADAVHAGAATLTVKGLGDYHETREVPYSITAKSIAGVFVAAIPDQPYAAQAIIPDLEIRDPQILQVEESEDWDPSDSDVSDAEEDGVSLVLDTDYTVTGRNNIKAGTASLTIRGEGDYKGTLRKTFRIVPKPVSMLLVEEIPAEIYHGLEHRPVLTVKNGDILLEEGSDYTLSYRDNLHAGTAYVDLKGLGNYTESRELSFVIRPKSVQELTVADIPSREYNAAPYLPQPEVTDGDLPLTLEEDYSFTYADNTKAGTATLSLQGLGDYEGQRTISYTITPRALSAMEIGQVTDVTYHNPAILPLLTITDLELEQTLVPDTDYTLSCQNNENAGEATAILSGMGNYTGQVTRPFRILPADLERVSIAAIENQTYTGQALMPAPVVTDGTSVLTAGRDYTLAYRDNMQAGTATITFTGIGNYTGMRTSAFRIQERVPEETGGSGEDPSGSEGSSGGTDGTGGQDSAQTPAPENRGDVSDPSTVAGVNDTITSADTDDDIVGSAFRHLRLTASKVAKTSIKLKWTPVEGASGYLIYGAKCGGKTKLLKEVSASQTTWTQKKLKKGKYYKYMMVAYSNEGGRWKVLASSKMIHIVTSGGKYSNPKSVRVNRKNVSLKKRKTFQIKPTNVMPKKGATMRSHRKVCYESSNPAIATVTKKGKIKAKKAGTCYIYAYAQNGVFARIKVTVK